MTVSASPAVAAQDPVEGTTRYDQCLSLTERAPSKAIDQGFAWEAEQGGALARHCIAIGLFRLGQYKVAGERLEALGEDIRLGRGMPVIDGQRLAADATLIGQVFDQAANAWLLAGNIDRAEAAIDRAISVTPDRSPQLAPLLIDRARIAAAGEDWSTAYKDLLRARELDPRRRDILLLVASAARHLGYGQEAELALNNYFRNFPDDPAAYLELGNLRDLQGRIEDARRAYLKVLNLEDMGVSSDAARANLARIDLKGTAG